MFRDLPSHQTFEKWQWITANLSKSHKDSRTESWELDHDHIVVGPTIGTSDRGWAERIGHLDHLPNDTIESLKGNVTRSLGWVQPRRIDRFYWKPHDETWPLHLQIEQIRFLGSPREPIEKVPYTFFAKFRCTDGCSHDMSIIDWEIYALYRKNRDPDKVVQKLTEISQSRRLSFFVGTSLRNHAYGSYMVIGLFYPPRIVAPQLL